MNSGYFDDPIGLKARRAAPREQIERDGDELVETQRAVEQARAALTQAKQEIESQRRELKTTQPQRETRETDATIGKVQASLEALEKVSGYRRVVISADRTLGEAAHEQRRARGAGHPNAAVYLRDNSYRTVIEFPTEAEARAALPAIRPRLSNDAYRRDVEARCPAPQNMGEYFQCAE